MGAAGYAIDALTLSASAPAGVRVRGHDAPHHLDDAAAADVQALASQHVLVKGARLSLAHPLFHTKFD